MEQSPTVTNAAKTSHHMLFPSAERLPHLLDFVVEELVEFSLECLASSATRPPEALPVARSLSRPTQRAARLG